jgi:hypothetical protein
MLFSTTQLKLSAVFSAVLLLLSGVLTPIPAFAAYPYVPTTPVSVVPTTLSPFGKVVHLELQVLNNTSSALAVQHATEPRDCRLIVDFADPTLTATASSPVANIFAGVGVDDGSSTGYPFVTTQSAGTITSLNTYAHPLEAKTTQVIDLDFDESIVLADFLPGREANFDVNLILDATVPVLETLRILHFGCNVYEGGIAQEYRAIIRDNDADTTVSELKYVHNYSENFNVGYVYRAFNKTTGTHLFSTKGNEIHKLVQTGMWRSEGIAWVLATTSNVTCNPGRNVYRFYSPALGRHFYTISDSEKNKLINDVNHIWLYERIIFCGFTAETFPTNQKPIYRFYNKTVRSHFYTIKESERSKLLADPVQWQAEGISYYAVPYGEY